MILSICVPASASPIQLPLLLFTNAEKGIVSTFTESVTGSKGFAYFMTFVVGVTIFGSVFSMLIGFTYLLQGASEQGHFFKWFAHKHPKRENLADRALLTLAGSRSNFLIVLVHYRISVAPGRPRVVTNQ